MNVNIINLSKHPLPAYETAGSAGMDIRANINQLVEIEPFGRVLIKTGLFIELPNGFEAQIRTRSGMALKKGLSVLNSPGTIDADYRGEIGVILVNISNEKKEIKDGDRIAQMVIAKIEQPKLIEVTELNQTKRGAGGFGSTGYN
jgi:dUTP pyrophosphatase